MKYQSILFDTFYKMFNNNKNNIKIVFNTNNNLIKLIYNKIQCF